MRWTPQEKITLRELYRQQIPIAEISRQLHRTTASVNSGLTSFGISRLRSVPKLRLPDSMTPALARLHAHVCGDGHLFAYKERDQYGYLSRYRQGYYRYRYGFGYTNMNPRLLESFAADVKEAFRLTPRYELKYNLMVRSKGAWELLRRLGAGKSRAWSIHPTILEATDAIAAAWLGAFFDDEAHFVARGGIRVRSVNREGIEQAASMLRRFVPCHITPASGLYPDTSCYLAVFKPDRARFLQLIGSLKLLP